ncbi:hypothetical protein GCM10023189_19950 [Nibrella saemangeumensis]|uniref:Uncharacterized protein n=1 Tax=Nibrella saemangeumensis TaxID=1084526 RepID=A0ABP8MQ17_9BACT
MVTPDSTAAYIKTVCECIGYYFAEGLTTREATAKNPDCGPYLVLQTTRSQTMVRLPGIADREITRVTNWPCQAMAYNVCADRIRRLAEQQRSRNPRFPPKAFHQASLTLSYYPLAIVEK